MFRCEKLGISRIRRRRKPRPARLWADFLGISGVFGDRRKAAGAPSAGADSSPIPDFHALHVSYWPTKNTCCWAAAMLALRRTHVQPAPEAAQAEQESSGSKKLRRGVQDFDHGRRHVLCWSGDRAGGSGVQHHDIPSAPLHTRRRRAARRGSATDWSV
jgi:hypothetical protein